MAEGCGAKCAKFLLIAFNIVFWLCGAAIMAIGIWMLLDESILKYLNIVYADNTGHTIRYAAYVAIAVGGFTFVTGFAGCCGAIKESPCLLGVYIFLLVLIMAVEIAVGVLAFVFRNRIKEEITEGLDKTFRTQNYTNGTDKDGKIKYSNFGTGLNLFQQQFKCCGVNGSDDYQYLPDRDRFDDGIPYSCCKIEDSDKRSGPQKDDTENQKCNGTDVLEFVKKDDGCRDALLSWMDSKAVILIGIGIGIACLEIFGIIFAVCLCRNPTDEKYA